jgi:hypothetical protein
VAEIQPGYATHVRIAVMKYFLLIGHSHDTEVELKVMSWRHVVHVVVEEQLSQYYMTSSQGSHLADPVSTKLSIHLHEVPLNTSRFIAASHY